jgi:hypothetical protein
MKGGPTVWLLIGLNTEDLSNISHCNDFNFLFLNCRLCLIDDIMRVFDYVLYNCIFEYLLWQSRNRIIRTRPSVHNSPQRKNILITLNSGRC